MCYKNFFGRIFLGSHTVQTVPKYMWMWHCRVTRKEAQKRLQDTENIFRKNLQLKDVC